MRAILIDFYVDEPACFGVPPYISPYIRYTAGALVKGGLKEKEIDYITIDQLRENDFIFNKSYDFFFIIAGSTVPGKYLGGKIGTVAEVLALLEKLQSFHKHSMTILGGPIKYASKEIKEEIAKKNGFLIRGDIEKYAEILPSLGSANAKSQFKNERLGIKRTYSDVDDYAQYGAFITNLHPNFPNLIVELETYRGCTRDVYCSFCTEAFYGRPEFRMTHGIEKETKELYNVGNRFFRLGRQADLMTYLPDMNDFRNSFPRPVPKNILELYTKIRRVAPDLKLLHLDNINPGLIATFPSESEEILKIITDYNTEGDTAAMGIESVDPEVIIQNDLKCSKEEAKFAIELVNKYGSKRVNGIPKLLPGLNFIGGLTGESKDTFKKNFDFLKNILNEGYLLRRINIRQVISYNKTKLSRSAIRPKNKKFNENRFFYYREKIRKEIDEPMLKKTFPHGSILKNVIIEKISDGYYLGRQLGSYPITVKIPYYHKTDNLSTTIIHTIVVGYSERSIKALPHPIPINDLTDICFREIPGVGKSLATKSLLQSPFLSMDDIQARNPDLLKALVAIKAEIQF